ncbi:MAG: Flp pilus assembly complex ATPase component TadA [Alkalimonas sp.]|nr:Flp pilus assembly complex ATPase component TadA [Alkalimonas sp.]
MFTIRVITDKGTNVGDFDCINGDCSIGTNPENLIVLRGFNVDDTHAFIKLVDGEIFIYDNKSVSGTCVNEKKINYYGPILSEDKIKIGNYLIDITYRKKIEHISKNVKAPGGSDALKQNVESLEPEESGKIKKNTVNNEHVRIENEWRRRIHSDLLNQMDLRRINVNEMSDSELRTQVKEVLTSLVHMYTFPEGINGSILIEQVLNETIGLGPLEELLADEDVSEIMVNSYDEIFYEKGGCLYLSDVVFSDHQAVFGAIERIVTPIGRRIDESSPMVDARLKDGSRVNAVIPPLALKGPCITIRKFMQSRLSVDDLIQFGALNSNMAEFLSVAVLQKRNIVISGGTGSGKTTLLNVLSSFIPNNERIITVEDAAELKLNQPNLISLEARPANQEGKGEVRIRELVKNCLRMRPDRVVVGECRGGEALDMLQAMNTGHDGSLTTTHANSPRDCLSRLEVMVMMAGMDLPLIAIREQIASAVQIIVQQSRFSDGSRRITSITEITGIEGNMIQLNEIFKFQQTGYSEDGKVQGYFTATGAIPEFYQSLKARGVYNRLDIFNRENN